MKYLLIIIPFFYFANLRAQQKSKPCTRYDALMKAGREILHKDTVDYEKALNHFLSAQIAARECGNNTDEVNKEIKKVFDLIKNERDRAVHAEREAKMQKAIAEKAFEEANREKTNTQKALEEANSEKIKTQKAFARADSLFA